MRRALWLLGLGGLATLVLHLVPPLPEDDPLRSSLILLPLVMGSLAAIYRLGTIQGGRRIPWSATGWHLLALGAFILLALARPSLAFPHSAEVVGGGFLLLLAQRLGLQIVALRPLLGKELTGSVSWLFWALPMVAYLALIPWATEHRPPDGDEPYYLLITHSLAYDLDAELTNNYARGDWRHFLDRPLEPQPGDPVGPGGEIYSRHNALLPLVLAPAYRLGGKLGALATMAALAAALAWLTLRLGRHYCPNRPGEALVAYGLLAFASPLLLYAHQVWVEVPATLLAMMALDQILGLKRDRRWGWRKVLAMGLPLLLLPLLKIRFALLAGPLFALAWWYAGRPRKPLILLGALLALLSGAILLHNELLYDNPLKIHTLEELELHHYPPLAYVKGFLGIFFDAAFGLFPCTPIWLLLVPAVLLLLARRHPLPADLAVYALPYLLVVSPRPEWFGGWSPPFRYAMVIAPLMALALVPLLARRRQAGAGILLGGLGALTLVLVLLWVLVPGWTYNFADGRTYLLDHLSARLETDIARLFPSMVRPRLATWIWPLASSVLVSLLWWFPRRQPRSELLWGAVALLVAASAALWAAGSLPTRVVEFEDPYVEKHGGHLHPDRWVVERPRYRGGWVVRPGEEVRVPIIPGGAELDLRLQLLFVRNNPGPVSVEIAAGEQPLASWKPGRDRVWTELSLGPVSWPPGAPLVVRVTGIHQGKELNGVVLDRARLTWK